jgi:hypothetical protein
MLLLQGGTAGVVESGINRYRVELDVLSNGQSGDPFLASVDFFTRFSNPSNALYNWNRSLSDDRSLFLRQDLLLYFGFGSEARRLEALNPNFNFDIAEVPQSAAATVRRTYGEIFTLVPLRTSDNISGAYKVMGRLSRQESVSRLAESYEMVPAYRSLVVAGSNDVYGRIRFAAAPVAYGWLNPGRRQIGDIFNTLLEDISSNRRTTDEAVNDAIGRIGQSY